MASWSFSFRLVVAIVEELLARDLVPLHRVNADFFQRDPPVGSVAGDVQGEGDGELVRAVKKRPADLFTVERQTLGPILRLLDHRLLANSLLAVALNGDDVGGVHRAHDVKVLSLVAQVDEFFGERVKAHEGLLLAASVLKCEALS